MSYRFTSVQRDTKQFELRDERRQWPSETLLTAYTHTHKHTNSQTAFVRRNEKTVKGLIHTALLL